MAKNKQQETILDREIDLQEQYGKAEDFIEKNRNLVIAIGALILLVAIAYFGFYRVYLPGQEAEANANMYKAQQYFQKDSFRLAINGDGNNDGFLDIIDSYSGMTKSANLAQYYTGISYLNMGKYDEAIEHLSNYSGSDMMTSAMATGAIGDAHMELQNVDQGIKYYKQAANSSDNKFTAPLFLWKAGMALESQGKFSEAKNMYSQIKSKYPDAGDPTNLNIDIDKYLARVEARL